MFKTETHLHTSEASPCSRLSAVEMVRLYAEAGYSTIFIADHLLKRYFDKLGDISWREKIKAFFTAYDLAKAEGDRLGVNVLLSAEIGLTCSPNHYLIYGFDYSFIEEREDLFSLSVKEFCDYAHDHGVTVVQAHPYRDGETVPSEDGIDALEVHNPNPRHENYTDRAIAYAKEHGLAMTCGSDAHRPEDIARGGVMTDFEIKTTTDYVNALMQGKLTLIGREDV